MIPLLRSDAVDLPGTPWERHTIDATARGADGIRLGDLNRDGRLDLVTGWEESGVIRAYLNPGPERVKERWPAVTVGRVKSPEDAVFIDLDGDGWLDVVSSCEGRTRTVHAHWNPGPDKLLNEEAWETEPFPETVGRMMWMWALPFDVDGRNGIDLVLGGKGDDAMIGWLRAPADPRSLADWRWRPIRAAGWIMSIEAVDLDGDGALDLLCSDRKGDRRGVFWLERKGTQENPAWIEHPIGGHSSEVMFLQAADLDRDSQIEVIAADRERTLLIFRAGPDARGPWLVEAIDAGESFGTGKAAAAADLNGDGRVDLALTAENARGRHGIVWLPAPVGDESGWTPHRLSGVTEGTKFDLVRLLDLDEDGDLDPLTCEERDNLGVIWYENPFGPFAPAP